MRAVKLKPTSSNARYHKVVTILIRLLNNWSQHKLLYIEIQNFNFFFFFLFLLRFCLGCILSLWLLWNTLQKIQVLLSVYRQPKPSFICKKSFRRLFEHAHLPCFAGFFTTFVLYSLRSVNQWSLSPSNPSFNMLGYLSHVLMSSFPQGDLLEILHPCFIAILNSFLSCSITLIKYYIL